MAAQVLAKKFLDRLLSTEGIIPSLEPENASSVIPRPGYTEKGMKVEQCTEQNTTLPSQITRAYGTHFSVVAGTNLQELAGRENIAVTTSRNEPSEDPA